MSLVYKTLFLTLCEQKINKTKKYSQAGTQNSQVDRCMTHKSKHLMLSLNKVVPHLLVATYAKVCIGLGWARTLNHTLDGTGHPVTTKVKVASMLIYWLSG